MKTVIVYSVVTRSAPDPTIDGIFRITIDPTNLAEPCLREKSLVDGTWTRLDFVPGEAMIWEALTFGTPPVTVVDGVRYLHFDDLKI